MGGGHCWSLRTNGLDCTPKILHLEWRGQWDNVCIDEHLSNAPINSLKLNQLCRVRIRAEENGSHHRITERSG